MKPGTPVSSPSPLRLLNRGPEYLRRQMQSDDRSPVRSAVERLEADKAKYVKSQQAMSSRQDPASPSQAASALPGHSRGHGQPNAADLSRLQPGSGHITKENTNFELLKNVQNVLLDGACQESPTVRRANARRMPRPDSLIMYRQKWDGKGRAPESGRGYGFIRRLFRGSVREKQTASLDRVKDGARARHVNDSDSTPDTKNDYIFLYPHTNVAISPGICRARLQRSAKVSGAAVLSVNSDPDQRSSAALSEAERFFNECGLDPEVVRQLASARPQPSGTATSHSSEPCGHSADREGIYEEEMNKQVPAEVSVIERNARVIKWLYGCKKAKEGPRESTV
eukprot:gi/632954720/ref/XP_007893111.1/ PREDICTED: protein FAM110D [Callorhinchus milii]